MSIKDNIELRMIMADWCMKDRCVCEQHEHLYAFNSAASPLLDRFLSFFPVFLYLLLRFILPNDEFKLWLVIFNRQKNKI